MIRIAVLSSLLIGAPHSVNSFSTLNTNTLDLSNVVSSAQRVFTTANEAFQAPPSAFSITATTEKIRELEAELVAADADERQNNHNHNVREARVTHFLLKTARSSQLNRLLRDDRDAYITTATFLNSQIPRSELPNLQDIPHPQTGVLPSTVRSGGASTDYLGRELVPDCTVPDLDSDENLAEALLLEVTRNIYANQTGLGKNEQKGIRGLVEEMRVYMLSEEGADPLQQQKSLVLTLYTLMTPVLPPFYRIFMGWMVPSGTAGDPEWLVKLGQRLGLEEGKNFGPAPYAPILTSIVAPFVFGFLVGPVRVNRRSDGQYGGIVVEKCKFLQESGCKGMCLHSCKLPAQQLFDELGLPLRVSPDFDSQECQWNFGEAAPPVEEDPTWPQGCLSGCGTREAVAEMRRKGVQGAELANCY